MRGTCNSVLSSCFAVPVSHQVVTAKCPDQRRVSLCILDLYLPGTVGTVLIREVSLYFRGSLVHISM